MAYQAPHSNQSLVDTSVSKIDNTEAHVEAPMTDLHLDGDDNLTWTGGEHYYEAPHDPFCFMCGSGENIFDCLTCVRSYHAHCMYPPLEPSQVPDLWFCPLCVGRNWHVPPTTTQTSPTTLPSTSVSSTPLPSEISKTNRELESIHVMDAADFNNTNQGLTSDPSDDIGERSQRWKDTQLWKERAWLKPPHGYILDPNSAERYIGINGEDRSMPFSTAIQSGVGVSEKVLTRNEPAMQSQKPVIPPPTQIIPHSKPLRTEKAEISQSRKRLKYSNLPRDVEKALDLIKSHLETGARHQKSKDDVEGKTQALEQKMRIQEGEVLLCRQELKAAKERLSAELSNSEKMRAENAELRKTVQELQRLAQKKDNEVKNWQKMLQTMMGGGEEPSTSIS